MKIRCSQKGYSGFCRGFFLGIVAKNEPLLSDEIPASPGEGREQEGWFRGLIQGDRAVVDEAVENPAGKVYASETDGFATIESSMAESEVLVREESPNGNACETNAFCPRTV